MENFKDHIEEKIHRFLSINFLMADFHEDQPIVDNLVKENKDNNKNKNDASSVYSCKGLDTYLFHKYISRTFEIGKCRRTE
jgi:hypothetical protein